jgi:hypothetical protein
MRDPLPGEYAPHNAMSDPGEIARFHDRCSDFMRELLEALAATPGRPAPFPEIEDSIGWPHRRIASVLGGVHHLRYAEFGGRRPYRFKDPRRARSARWELWMDADQARAVNAAAADTGHGQAAWGGRAVDGLTGRRARAATDGQTGRRARSGYAPAR